jgi:hypothetical protein
MSERLALRLADLRSAGSFVGDSSAANVVQPVM